MHPREAHGVEGIYLNPARAYFFKVVLFEWKVAVLVADGIEDNAHMHALLHLVCQQVEEAMADAVVLEFKIVEMDVLACSCDVVEECLELLVGRGQQFHVALVVEFGTKLCKCLACSLA